jgi:hypothetical protein
LGVERWYVDQMIKGLTKEEKQSMVKMITNEFISSLSPADRREMVKIVLPDIVDQLTNGMSLDDRKELVETMIPLLIAQLEATRASNQDKKEGKTHSDAAMEKQDGKDAGR